MQTPRSLTLIVAATDNMGIGINGALPWPTLKLEMAYFARVTKRAPSASPAGTQNTVIMGRKTWDSIPQKFRPLRGRYNVVVSQTLTTTSAGVTVVPRLEDVFEKNNQEDDLGNQQKFGHTFVIGGSSIYAAALKLRQADRVLLTKVKKSFDCDTFFPVDLDGEAAAEQGWSRKSKQQLADFIGEDLHEDVIREGDIEYEFCLYEKDN